MIKHSIANYPKGFLGCVVSPTKICLQFEDVQSKLRVKEGADYVKLPDTSKALPISHLGTDVDILAVGCQMPVLEDAQFRLIEAYDKYGKLYSDVYAETYEGKQFIDYLKRVSSALNNVITKLDRD